MATHVYICQLVKIYNWLVSSRYHRKGQKGGKTNSPASRRAVCSKRQDSGKIRVAEDGHGQQDDAVDVHDRPPQRLLGGVCHHQLHGCLLLLCHLGSLLLVQATEQVIGLPAASFFLLGIFCVGEKE